MPSQTELRTQITATIIDAIQNKNLLPWRCPWTGGKGSGRHRNISGRAYSGINPLLCEVHAVNHGFTSRTWGTFKQWADLGLQVTKRPDDIKAGAWGCNVVLYRPVKKTKIDRATGEESLDSFMVARQFYVFNADQVSGLGVEKYQKQPTAQQGGFEADFGPAEDLIRARGAVIIHTGCQAYYKRPTPEGTWPNHTEGDWIIMPPKEKFESAAAYYATLLHETAHFAELRLGWDHRKHGYAMGELVAEMSSAFLCAELGVPQGKSLEESSAAYLKTWLEGMKGDISFIGVASSQASKVTEYLLSFVRKENNKEVEMESLVGAA